jgi:hypothetical protein
MLDAISSHVNKLDTGRTTNTEWYVLLRNLSQDLNNTTRVWVPTFLDGTLHDLVIATSFWRRCLRRSSGDACGCSLIGNSSTTETGRMSRTAFISFSRQKQQTTCISNIQVRTTRARADHLPLRYRQVRASQGRTVLKRTTGLGIAQPRSTPKPPSGWPRRLAIFR